ncbi:hypothetical protein QO003_003935 [Arthrobacter silviterrae]|uniref:LysM peptidoglycan-binding domain-containing protein n=1 Tax=Arthrobacter silviterrae TaxID=2026658 RepID=A0ABX0D881_9MICC|nr:MULTISPECIES: LysM peptidoglycan-binding domain-containing protein [Arthrobacter]MCU6479465.1 LysM peptidoglycan-binding domain-containing protein [Arthrobacter sp. A2-55]MDQ0279632.1 hypothetical protein [Arthrobacter silviterrae]NGN81891.1 LysM peptidoglycan-binding domain-containing protein [Arthrobacter silviterrae]
MSALVFSQAGPHIPARPLTLTRRGRVLLLGIPSILVASALVFTLLAVLLGAIASPANAATTHSSVDMADYAGTVTVLQGQSLWSIAAASDPTRDIRDVVSDIVALNGLTTGVLQAGQQLYVPRAK